MHLISVKFEEIILIYDINLHDNDNILIILITPYQMKYQNQNYFGECN